MWVLDKLSDVVASSLTSWLTLLLLSFVEWFDLSQVAWLKVENADESEGCDYMINSSLLSSN